MKSESTTYRNQAAQRVLSVLNAFTRYSEPVSAIELGAQLDMSKNMIHRALTLLTEEGLVVRAADGGYRLGPKVLTFIDSDDGATEDVNAICRPFMQQLSDMTGESIFLGIIVGRNRVVIDKIDGIGRRVAHSQRGLALPLHVTKASRVLLAFLSDEEIHSYLATVQPPAFYADLIQVAAEETLDDVWDDIRTIRTQGYISWRSSAQYGGAYVAFPVLDSERRPQAVLSIGAPLERMPQERLDQLIQQMKIILKQVNDQTQFIAPLPPLAPAPATL